MREEEPLLTPLACPPLQEFESCSGDAGIALFLPIIHTFSNQVTSASSNPDGYCFEGCRSRCPSSTVSFVRAGGTQCEGRRPSISCGCSPSRMYQYRVGSSKGEFELALQLRNLHRLFRLFQVLHNQQFVATVINHLDRDLPMVARFERCACGACQMVPNAFFVLPTQRFFKVSHAPVRGKKAWQTWKQRSL